MTIPGDDTIRHLRQVVDLPDLSGTKYKVLDFVARGGMGSVYRVHDVELDRDAALKVLSVPDKDGGLGARMVAEAKIIARLEHPGIVPVHDVGTLPDGRVYYAMKFVAGQDLEVWTKTGPLLSELLGVFTKVCDAVAFAHSRGIVHRDLKPGNIMVGDFGEVLVLDWGVAKWTRQEAGTAKMPVEPGKTPQANNSRATQVGAVMGTPGFMSPEQARGESHRVDPRSDVFALGAILRFFIDTVVPDQPPKRLVAIAQKAMSATPAGRYETADELREDVVHFLAGSRVRAYEDTIYDKALRFVSRHRMPIALIATYLLFRILLIVFRGI